MGFVGQILNILEECYLIFSPDLGGKGGVVVNVGEG